MHVGTTLSEEFSGVIDPSLFRLSYLQGRPKAPPATQNVSQKSLGGDKNKEVKGDKIYLFVSRENKCIKMIIQ